MQSMTLKTLKVIGYIKYEFNFFVVLKLLTGRWLVGQWSVHVVVDRLVDGEW